eukprot:scaffold207_cov267-Pinguiococcus_pyrenoidosus.AAC.5
MPKHSPAPALISTLGLRRARANAPCAGAIQHASMLRRTLLRGLSSSAYVPPHVPGKWYISEPEAPAKGTEIAKETEYIIVGQSRPGRIQRHNYGVAACGVVPRGVNMWGFPTKEFLMEQSNGQMTLVGALRKAQVPALEAPRLKSMSRFPTGGQGWTCA